MTKPTDVWSASVWGCFFHVLPWAQATADRMHVAGDEDVLDGRPPVPRPPDVHGDRGVDPGHAHGEGGEVADGVGARLVPEDRWGSREARAWTPQGPGMDEHTMPDFVMWPGARGVVAGSAKPPTPCTR